MYTMYSTLHQEMKGVKIIGETLAKKQFNSNTSKSKFVLLGEKIRTWNTWVTVYMKMEPQPAF